MDVIELGGWNLPEGIEVPADPVDQRDFTGFEL